MADEPALRIKGADDWSKSELELFVEDDQPHLLRIDVGNGVEDGRVRLDHAGARLLCAWLRGWTGG